MTLAARIERGWWRRATGIVPVLLAPLAGIFAALAALRRWLYRRGWLACMRLPVPVVVVGNIAVGGTGKTPLTLALAEALRERGFTPGIVSRGYGRRASVAQEVTPTSTWREVGDEPLVLARSGVPVWVGAKRAIAASSLLAAQRGVDVIVSDDGLQHYALARDFEIAVVDSQRGVGNGRLLPAGPLREPVSRLASVDAIVVREAVPGTAADDPPDAGAKDGRGLAPASLPFDMAGSAAPCYAMHYEAQAWRNLVDEAVRLDAGSLGSARPGAESPGDVVAIAGIADPEAFFAEVAARGIRAHARAFPDHHAYRRQELAFPGARAILMTEKDAVKCREFGDARMWFLPIRAVADPALVGAIVEKLRGSEAARDARLPGDQGTADP